MKILFAVDGSSYTAKAVEYVIAHFDIFKDKPEIHVLHVMSPIPTFKGRAAAVVGQDAVDNYYKTEAQEALAPAEAIFKKNNISLKGGYCIGDIAQQIDTYAQDNKIDLIVIGSHGHGALKNLVMGSVATKILAGTKTPVLIVR